jgi:hypothetical protein
LKVSGSDPRNEKGDATFKLIFKIDCTYLFSKTTGVANQIKKNYGSTYKEKIS